MKEYGGFIELDTYRLPMLHEGAVALNCGRNCLAYLIKEKKIKKICVPYFMCDSVFNLCRKYDVTLRFYHIDEEFHPVDISLADDEWLHLMNYYGQLTNEYIYSLKKKYDRVIVDNAQAYFAQPLKETDTIYTCRKFFGVSDGAFLYTNSVSPEEYPADESFNRMRFLLGRFERSASEFYSEYSDNNHMFAGEPIKKMSKLTENLLHGIDYDYVMKKRTDNFSKYHDLLGAVNGLSLKIAEGAFAYPLLVDNAPELRKALQNNKIYIPTLWPNVLNEVEKETIEYKFVNNILPLPCDQRYNTEDIIYISECIKNGGSIL